MAQSILVEQWAEVAGHPDYAVSNMGRVKRVTRARGARPGLVMATPISAQGYLYVKLGRKGGVHNVHALVCEAFHGPKPTPDHVVAHGDGDRTNAHAGNLRWATRAENEADKDLHGTRKRGEELRFSKLNVEQVLAIRADTRTHREISGDYDVSQAQISRVKRRAHWGHI